MDGSISPRIKRLVDSGIFKDPEIDRLGYGTFQKQQGAEPNQSVRRARDLRARVGAVLKESRREGAKMLMEIVLMYIKGYMEESARCRVVDMIRRWKGLAKYIAEAMEELGEEEAGTLLRTVLFNVKFHYLHLESSLIAKQGKKSEGRESILVYFLNEYNDLYSIFASSKAKGFSVLQLCDLEDMIREKINSM
ncbi:hypothetical protein M970_060820 [Encephalitozoon cuniculi EcunIII-L]|uniref:Uncharacterized protein n=1 Tax=Encephalitozoon cuniculi TaxID=6035 RepID=M1K9D7_ENCCN|nr:hypothetical protein ECU06_0890 [Encephalitozoon cuniculi]KMV65983.1 hypothetical protein M970_060820 [Encephalitozoon cuniculi EcunIII-L]UYI27680.1 hypothetical protein J0A71_07g15590 [Encephalitozoon cuniculi]